MLHHAVSRLCPTTLPPWDYRDHMCSPADSSQLLCWACKRGVGICPAVCVAQVDPTSKHQRSIEDLQASIRALLGSQHSVDSLRAQQALPRNRHARAQVCLASARWMRGMHLGVGTPDPGKHKCWAAARSSGV